MTSPTKNRAEADKLKAQSDALEKIHKLGGHVRRGKTKALPQRNWDAEREIDAMVGIYMQNICEQYNTILDGQDVGPLLHLFQRDVPVAIVGAGPSLDKNVEELRDFPGLIFACDRAAIPLTARGITPDLVVSVDPRRHVIAPMLDYPGSEKQTLVLGVCTSPEIPRVWKGRVRWYRECNPGTQFFDRILPAIFPGMADLFCVGNVGNSAVQLAGAMGCGTVVLVGQDYGYTGEKMQCQQYEVARTVNAMGDSSDVWITSAMDHAAAFKKRTGKIQVEGIWTYPPYVGYIRSLEQLVSEYKMDCINATEGGIIKSFPMATLKETVLKLRTTPENRAAEWSRHQLAEVLGGKE